jgi:hypothetical protein
MMRELTSKQLVRVVLGLALLWGGLLALPFTERTLVGAKTYYFLFVGLGLVFVMYGVTIRSVFSLLRHTKREPVYVWIGFLLWSVFLCGVLAVFGTEYDLLPPHSRPVYHTRATFL